MKEHGGEEGAEGERPLREGVPTQQKSSSQRKHDPLGSRSSETASGQRESADGDDPPESPQDAQGEGRPRPGQSLTTVKTPSC